MSTSYLYHTHLIRGYKYISTDYSNGEVVFNIKRDSSKMACKACGSSDVTAVYVKDRYFTTLPVGKKNKKSGLKFIA